MSRVQFWQLDIRQGFRVNGSLFLKIYDTDDKRLKALNLSTCEAWYCSRDLVVEPVSLVIEESFVLECLEDVD